MANDTVKRKKLPRYTTPEGVFVFPRVSAPGQNYNKDGMEYSTKFRLEAAEGKAIRAHFAPIIAEAVELGRAEFDALPLNTRKKIKGGFTANDTFGDDLFDEATEQPTGEIQLKFSRRAAGVSKKTGKPWAITLPIFDAKGSLMQGVDVWAGSRGRVSFEYEPYFIPGTGEAGLSKRLVAVQVTQLVSKGVLSADQYGFREEDGYTFSEGDANAAEPDTTSGDNAADETPDF